VGKKRRYELTKEARLILSTLNDGESISGTSRRLGISYKHTWDSIKVLENIFGDRIIETNKGGSSQGGTKITPFGKTVLEELEYIEKGINNLFKQVMTPKEKYEQIRYVGSQCSGLSLILKALMKKMPEVSQSVNFVGSEGGLKALVNNEADIAGIHLYDNASNKYNFPFISELKLWDKVVVLKGYKRVQGLIVGKGNPKGVQGIKDILIGDLHFLNRNKGSGSRTLLDAKLEETAKQRNLQFNNLARKIKGYGVEAMSSTEVARAVKAGIADLGLGNQASAVELGLNFIPIGEEEYDYVISKKSLNRKPIQCFLEILVSKKFQKKLMETLGIKTTVDTGKIISDTQ